MKRLILLILVMFANWMAMSAKGYDVIEAKTFYNSKDRVGVSAYPLGWSAILDDNCLIIFRNGETVLNFVFDAKTIKNVNTTQYDKIINIMATEVITCKDYALCIGYQNNCAVVGWHPIGEGMNAIFRLCHQQDSMITLID